MSKQFVFMEGEHPLFTWNTKDDADTFLVTSRAVYRMSYNELKVVEIVGFPKPEVPYAGNNDHLKDEIHF